MGACSRELGSRRSDPRLLSLAPYPHRAWCPASAGPSAHLFCALVTCESSPFLDRPSVCLAADTPWGLPLQLLALRGSCCAGPVTLGQALGVARIACPLPLLTSARVYLESPRAGAPRQAGLRPTTVAGGASWR